MEQHPAESPNLLYLDFRSAESIRAALPASQQLEPAASDARALGDPTRLTVAMALLHGGELCVCDTAWVVGQRQGLVSYHLRQLKSAGLVSARRQRQLMLYRLTQRGRALTEAISASVIVATDQRPDRG